MTLLELRTRVLTELGEDPSNPKFYTAAEADAAINDAESVFALLTLCLERTASLTLLYNTTWYQPRTAFSDFLLPLRVRRQADGAKVVPTTIEALNALSETWESEIGAPQRYVSLGCNLLAFHCQPQASDTVLVTFARTPAALTSDSATPEIPAQFHETLIDFAVPKARMKEGGGEFSKELSRMQRFMNAASDLADVVRRRNKALQYDRGPAELTRLDLSRLAEASSVR